MESEKVKEIKKALEQNDDNGIMYEVNDQKRICKFIHHKDILTLINELESENDTLHTNLCEYRRENKELGSVISIANEREYRKKFNDEWRKEYQKELDKQGNGHIAGHPDFDLVYKLYFEQKDRIAELENTDYYKEIEKKKEDLLCKEYGLIKYEKEIAGKYLKQFAERLKEKLEKYRLENEYFIKDEPNGNLWQLNSSVFYLEVTQDGGLVDEILKEYEK